MQALLQQLRGRVAASANNGPDLTWEMRGMGVAALAMQSPIPQDVDIMDFWRENRAMLPQLFNPYPGKWG